MNKQRIEESPMRMNGPRREVMKEPEEVAAMLRLWAVGRGFKRIGREFDLSGTWMQAGSWLTSNRNGHASSAAIRIGCESGFGSIAAMPTWFARN